MAKRFTDNRKWKKDFIKELPGAYKLLWFYIVDDCEHYGIWDVEIDIAQLRIGKDMPIDEQKAIEFFGDNIQVIDSGKKWFIPGFIKWQYGELTESNRVHKSVIIELDRLGLYKGLTSPLQGVKDKDKDKDKDKEKDKNKDKDKDKNKDMKEKSRKLLWLIKTTKKQITGKAANFTVDTPILFSLRRGHTYSELERLILNQVHNPYMRENPQYYNPDTLMRESHFDKYLNTDYDETSIEGGKSNVQKITESYMKKYGGASDEGI